MINGLVTIFKCNVISVLLYGCETWQMTKRDEKKLDVFLHKSLCQIIKIYWPMQITNKEIRTRAGGRVNKQAGGKKEMDVAGSCP